MSDNVYIIILNWNGSKDTIECLKSLKDTSYETYTTVVVDNGSEDEDIHKLKTWCNDNYALTVYYGREEAEHGGIIRHEEYLNNIPSSNRLVFIENNDNLGFAAGNNVALRYALRLRATYAMLLNNDTVIEKDSISILMDFLNANKHYVAVTPQIRYYEPRDRVWNCGGKIMWFGNRRYYFAGAHISKVPQAGFKDITFITGCALLFKPQIAGILTEKFFFGEEDLDFSFRQQFDGNRMACCFSSVVYHKVSASVHKMNVENAGHIYLHYLSRLINNRQYASPFRFMIITFLTLAYAVPMMKIRYKHSFRTIFRVIVKIYSELRVTDIIDRDYCFKYLKEDFSRSK